MFREILMDRSSRSFAALAGWSFIPDPADKYIHAASQTTRMRRRPAWEKPDPLTMPSAPGAHTAAVHDEALRDRLNARLGITSDQRGA
ncbi:hypothetical protein BW12_07085 [Bifidobacterium sp. UTCIF-3]|nr:hypothetical protein BW09_04660 [Bifidobacterium sp. UTCIF-1]TPF81230.1 hypothetical protein BW08_00920 [Bifidobacterium sp. UTCIF-24]TPF82011.1 hypothetical protein BW12_07085 [Bifidobacterium sp. UTCIF-3]TPF85141.1 hypothetical protein BW07_00265 [Bifidobacterium sp. UTCIF-36]TPF91986.1 hypothetical protein BW14_10760 [Bifidobacterium sp. UTBIF-68]